MKKCCLKTFELNYKQMLRLLEDEKDITRESLIQTLRYALSELDRVNKEKE